MVVSNHDIYLNDKTHCNIEEEDERLQLNTLDVSKSFDRVLIKTVDSDVIIATVAFQKNSSISVMD